MSSLSRYLPFENDGRHSSAGRYFNPIAMRESGRTKACQQGDSWNCFRILGRETVATAYVIRASSYFCETRDIRESTKASYRSSLLLTTEQKQASSSPQTPCKRDMIELGPEETPWRRIGILRGCSQLGIPRSTLESKIRSLK